MKNRSGYVALLSVSHGRLRSGIAAIIYVGVELPQTGRQAHLSTLSRF